MSYVITAEVNPNHVDVRAVGVACSDPRFGDQRRDFEDQYREDGVLRFDPVYIPGGAEALTLPGKELVLAWIKLLAEAHNAKYIDLLVHMGCKKIAFKGTAETERAHLIEILREAAREVRDYIPGIPVRFYVAGFNGIELIES